MSLGHAPKIVTDGLVFYYDMFNTQKSWLGAPTTNLCSNPSMLNGTNWNTWSGRGVSSWSFGTLDGYNVAICDMSLNAGELKHLFQDITVPAVLNTYALSIDVLVIGDPTGVFVNQEYPFGNSFGSNTYNVSKNGQWQRLYSIRDNAYVGVTTNPDTRVRIYFGSSNTTASSTKIYFRNPQVELNTFATPFVNGTRTNTQALLDLTKNTTATLNNLTYLPDGTFNFNGTTNLITVPSFNINNTNYSVEVWFYCNTINRVNGLVGDLQFDWWTFQVLANNKIRCRHKESDVLGGPTLVSNTTVSAQIWYNATMTFNTVSGMKLYINGKLDISTTNIQPFTITNRGPQFIGQHRGSVPGSPEVMDGKISVVKIYKNKELSSEEVLQNFNALKGRYGY